MPKTPPAKVLVTHYGRLVNTDDLFVEGLHSFTVRLYTERVPGSSVDQQVWEDTFAGVPVTKGVFKLELGSGAPLKLRSSRAAPRCT